LTCSIANFATGHTWCTGPLILPACTVTNLGVGWVGKWSDRSDTHVQERLWHFRVPLLPSSPPVIELAMNYHAQWQIWAWGGGAKDGQVSQEFGGRPLCVQV
jgi:hypothetical protein